MEVVFIDPESPGPGGGIRTYLRLALALCRSAGVPARIYTHSPAAYPRENAIPIGRSRCLPGPLRGLAYRLGYAENVLWEQARWLERELEAGDAPGRVYEFADFLGYAFFALRNPRLRPRCLVRVHTPAFLIAPGPSGWGGRLISLLSARRERDCLLRTPCLTAPSAEFMREKLAWLQGWKHVPNPLPPDPEPLPASPLRIATRFLFFGRVEPRKGVLPLIRAFARMAGERPVASLTLVGPIGDVAYAREVKGFINSQPSAIRDRIAWEPPCSPGERNALFGAHTALVVPSLWENSPYVYFEGMAAGLSCIGSATGEMKAIARATGALCPAAGDEEAWAGALRAHCDGKDSGLPAAQKAYLDSRRAGADAGLLAAWREAAGEVDILDRVAAPESK
jgi:glycosyltransferase involved in cell wall biosynthesis